MSRSVVKIQNYIDGRFTLPGGEHIDSFDPATGEVNAHVPDSSAAHAELAVQAARKAYQSWSKTSIAQRSRILNQIANKIEDNLEELARLESQDQGKPLWQAEQIEIPRCVANLRHFGNALNYQTETSIVEPETGVINYTTQQPVGVVGVITPWNLPLYLLTFKLAPAIAYGNTVVAKPSEMTSVTAFRLCELLEETDLPKGVINMIFGYGHTVGQAIVAHSSVDAISFTGSTQTGQAIARLTASSFKKLSLEMGGKNAAIVFQDIDLQNDVLQIAKSVYFNSGQICLATSRILVHESIYERFLESFVQISRNFDIGPPNQPNTKIGPMVSRGHFEKVQKYIEMAKKSSTEVIEMKPSPGTINSGGYYVSKVIISNVDVTHPCWIDEVFGPVVCIASFKDEQEAIRLANQSVYGLSATVWTRSVDRLHRVAFQLDVGTVWANCWLVRNLNMPFGGMKHSGVGRESTVDSRDFYTHKKTICIKLN